MDALSPDTILFPVPATRGEPVVVCTDTAHKLRTGPYAGSFAVLDDATDPTAGSFNRGSVPGCC